MLTQPRAEASSLAWLVSFAERASQILDARRSDGKKTIKTVGSHHGWSWMDAKRRLVYESILTNNDPSNLQSASQSDKPEKWNLTFTKHLEQNNAELVTAPPPVHLPALIEDQSEWPAHGQRHCSSVAIHYLLCRFGSFASFDEQVDLRKGPNTPNYNSLNRNLPQGLPKQLLSLKRLPPSSGKPPKGSQTFSIQVASKSWKKHKILQHITTIYKYLQHMTRYYKIALSNPSTKDQIHLPVLCVSSAKCKNSNDSEYFECVCVRVCVCHSFHTDSIIIASYESCYRWWPHVSSKTGLWDSAKKMKCILDHFGVMYALNLSSGPLHSPAVLPLPFGPSNQTCLAALGSSDVEVSLGNIRCI